jgi:protein-S-isoprenylcysteine O-methyltransferase Ste14
VRRIHWHVVLAVLGLLLARPSLAMNLLGAALVLAGLALRLCAAGYLEKGGALCRAGPYACVRHPLYLGSFISALGFCVMMNVVWAWVVVLPLFIILYALQVSTEDRYLRTHYGEQHAAYAAQVPAIIPRFARSAEATAPWRLDRAIVNREHWHVLLSLALVGLFFAKWLWGGVGP